MFRFLHKYLYRSFQEELRSIRTKPELTKEQGDGMLSMLYQNEVFRTYCNKRENAIIIGMANQKPSDDEHLRMQGRRQEIMELFYTTKAAYNRTQKVLAQKREDRTSTQASA